MKNDVGGRAYCPKSKQVSLRRTEPPVWKQDVALALEVDKYTLKASTVSVAGGEAGRSGCDMAAACSRRDITRALAAALVWATAERLTRLLRMLAVCCSAGVLAFCPVFLFLKRYRLRRKLPSLNISMNAGSMAQWWPLKPGWRGSFMKHSFKVRL